MRVAGTETGTHEFLICSLTIGIISIKGILLSQVRNLDEVKFYPGKLLQSIVQIYINLKDEPPFVSAIPRDGRSYHPALFKDTAAKMRKLYVPEDVIADLLKV